MSKQETDYDDYDYDVDAHDLRYVTGENVVNLVNAASRMHLDPTEKTCGLFYEELQRIWDHVPWDER